MKGASLQVGIYIDSMNNNIYNLFKRPNLEVVHKCAPEEIMDIEKYEKNILLIIIDLTDVNDCIIDEERLRTILFGLKNKIPLIMILDRSNFKLLQLLDDQRLIRQDFNHNVRMGYNFQKFFSQYFSVLDINELMVIFGSNDKNDQLWDLIVDLENIIEKTSRYDIRQEFRAVCRYIINAGIYSVKNGNSEILRSCLGKFYYDINRLVHIKEERELSPQSINIILKYFEKNNLFSDIDIKLLNQANARDISQTKIGEDAAKQNIDLCIDHMSIPIIAPLCYKDAFLLDHSNAIKLMKNYLQYSSLLDKNCRLQPIQLFLIQDWAQKVFSKDLSLFLKEVLPCILEYNILEDFDELGLRINVGIIDLGRKLEDDFCIELKFPSREGYVTYPYTRLKKLLDLESINEIVSELDKSKRSIPIKEQLNQFDEIMIALDNHLAGGH
jgi:hypothetical protein